MPWNDQSGGGGNDNRGQGPWGSGGGGPRQPWGQPPRNQPPQQEGPDLEDMMRRFTERLRNQFGGGSGGNGGGRGGGSGRPRFSAPLIAGVVAFLWFATGVYVVDEGERGVVSRWGAYTDTTGPGLHWHLPMPIESARVVPVLTQRRLEIGSQSAAGQDEESDSLMITGDRNIVDVAFVVVYRLSDPRAYLFNVADPEDMVRGVAESSMREVIGQRQLQRIITTDRAVIEQAVERQIQVVLDGYRAGVQVMQIQLLRVGPPPAVQEAFNDVVRAGQSAETARNQATQYANERIPRARGEAAGITQAAEGYRERAVREANGDAERFRLLEAQYRAAPRVTRERLYLETMERIYRNADTIIVDRQAGAVPFLPLDQFRRQRPVPPAQPASPSIGPAGAQR